MVKGKPKVSVNEDFFENIDSEEKAYWLGFLFADGCIHRHDRVELQIIDLDHLEKYSKSIGYGGVIRHYKYGINSFNPGGVKYRIIFTSKKMCDDLRAKGCITGKTKDMQLPSGVSDELMKHFIRGFVDGDGSVYVSKRDGVKMDITGPKHFLEFIQEKLPTKSSISLDKGQSYKLGTGKTTVHWLYDDSEFYMDRKKDKIG